MKLRDSIPALAVLALLAAPAAAAATRPVAKPAKPAAATPQPPDIVDPVALAAQARAASARGEIDLAERLAQATIVASPAQAASYDLLGDVYAAGKKSDYARVYYNEALSIDPADAAATNAIASLDRAGDSRKADASDGAKPGIP